jgi:hypothetical protein
MTAALTCGITTGVVIYIESMDSDSPSSPTGECAKAKVQVVQSIPLGSPADPYSGAPYIPPIGGSVPSWEAFVRLTSPCTGVEVMAWGGRCAEPDLKAERLSFISAMRAIFASPTR